jgi:hypothetical protein
MDTAPSQPPMAVWGVVRAGAADPLPADVPPTLAGLLVVVDHAVPPPPHRGPVTVVRVHAPATAARAFAAAIRAAPAAADAVAWFDGALPTSRAIERLVAGLGTRDAAVVASSISDAVKQVQGGLVVGGVPRDGLCRPTVPVLVRAAVARERLLSALAGAHDVFDALSIAGCAVGLVAPWTPVSN